MHKSAEYVNQQYGQNTVVRGYTDSLYIRQHGLVNEESIIRELNDIANQLGGNFVIEK